MCIEVSFLQYFSAEVRHNAELRLLCSIIHFFLPEGCKVSIQANNLRAKPMLYIYICLIYMYIYILFIYALFIYTYILYVYMCVLFLFLCFHFETGFFRVTTVTVP